MRIFLTGASGFVGGKAARHLLDQGHEVLAMARSEASAAKVRALGAQVVRASLETVDAEHLADIEVVVHAAAYVEEYGPAELFERVNVQGTQRLLEAARQAGVRRFVHVGTVAATWDGEDLVGLTEERPLPEQLRFPYSRTKAAAERLVREASGLETVVLRPCFVWGEGDTTLLPALRRMVAEGSWAWLDGGQARVSTTHVDNLVHAIEQALTEGRSGAAYFVTDEEDHTLREFFGAVAQANGLALPERSMPGWLARSAAVVLENTWLLLGKQDPPPLTRFAAYAGSRSLTASSALAREELGYRPGVDLERGLADLAA